MPRRDDLIGLLRTLDETMSTIAPPAGHEARLRARLALGSAPARGRSVARPLVLALAAVAAATGVWVAWTAPPAPELSVRPLPAPSASASADVIAEPRPDPTATPTATPRWLPERTVPALPMLPPHSENAPEPGPAPPFPAPPPPETHAARERWTMVTPAMPREASVSAASAAPRDRSAGRASSPGAWSDGASVPRNEGRGAELGAMGSLVGEPFAASAGAHHGASSESEASPGGADGAANEEEPASECVWGSIGVGGTCLAPGELKDLGSAICAAKGETMADLQPSFDCANGGSTDAKLLCCGSAAATPGPEEPPAKCETVTIGDGATCTDAMSLEIAAKELCATMGMMVVVLGGIDDCNGGGSTMAKVQCCAAEGATVPDPAASEGDYVWGALGDGITCVPDATFMAAALDACDAEGLVLIDFVATGDCAPAVSRMAKYGCGP